MTSHLRTILAASGVFAAAAAFQPALHAQGFGGMFSGFNMNGVTQGEEETSTVITASAADIDLEHNIITLIGDVVVDDQANKITCNKMTIYLEEDAADSLVGTADKPEEKAGGKKEEAKPVAVKPADKEDGKDGKKEEKKENEEPGKNISKIVCSGDVVYTKRADPDDPNGQDQIAMSEQADYDAVKEVIVMTGNPVMMQGSNKMYGDRIEILIKEGNRMRVINPKVYYTGESFLSSPGGR
jgi:lipopolysaccharide export system protein LptA